MLKSVVPEAVGISSERLERLTAWLEQQVSSERLAGCSVLIGRRGEIPYFGSAGLADIEANRQFARNTIVRINSMTKAVTTVAAMMLYEQGAFNWTTPFLLISPLLRRPGFGGVVKLVTLKHSQPQY